jgi:uncharacterized membrane protein YfcA
VTGGEAALLVAGGLVAGVVNTMAGGGSLLTVPLLVLAGVPGNVANGSNRVGVLASNLSAFASFERLGVSGLRRSVPVLVPTVLGSFVGAVLVSRLADETFERAFGVAMVPLLVLALRRPRPASDGRRWSPPVMFAVFAGIGLYGGAFQAGVGLFLVLALAHAGFDLVTANAIKVVVILVLTVVALPVFVVSGQVAWAPALVLAAGFAVGGALGARLTVRGGERVVRPVLVVAVVALAGRMLGLY